MTVMLFVSGQQSQKVQFPSKILPGPGYDTYIGIILTKIQKKKELHEMDPKIVFSCTVLWVIFASTFASSCENIIRLADLRNTIINQTIQSEIQTGVIEEQRRINEQQKHLNENLSQVIEDLRKVLEDQREIIENQTKALHDLNTEHAGTGTRTLS